MVSIPTSGLKQAELGQGETTGLNYSAVAASSRYGSSKSVGSNDANARDPECLGELMSDARTYKEIVILGKEVLLLLRDLKVRRRHNEAGASGHRFQTLLITRRL